MSKYSSAFRRFKENMDGVVFLLYSLRYIIDYKEDFIKEFEKKGMSSPDDSYEAFIKRVYNQVLEIANILMRSWVEEYAGAVFGDMETFVKANKKIIDSCKVKYQRDLPELPVLDINRELRNYSSHSEKKYHLLKTTKDPATLLSELSLLYFSNDKERIYILLHDFSKNEYKQLLEDEIPPKATRTFCVFMEVIEKKILECIEKIEIYRNKRG